MQDKFPDSPFTKEEVAAIVQEEYDLIFWSLIKTIELSQDALEDHGQMMIMEHVFNE